MRHREPSGATALPTDFPDWAQHFADGAAHAGSAWRNLALGSIGLDGAPQIRTVVLRRFCGLALDIHTDTRSAKFAELQACARATLHGWDAAGAIQLRAGGRVCLHVGDAVAAQSWAALSARTRDTYRVQPGPGTTLAEPEAATAGGTEPDAQRVFCVVRLAIVTVDWLHLGRDGHRRARFSWADGTPSATWVAP